MIIYVWHPTQLEVCDVKFIAQEEITVGFGCQAFAELLRVALREEK